MQNYCTDSLVMASVILGSDPVMQEDVELGSHEILGIEESRPVLLQQYA